MSPRNVFIAGAIAFLAGAAALSVAVLQMKDTGGQTASQTSTVGGPFRLVDQDGKNVTEADLKGRATVVFFGFTHCPDICPTALYEISQALNELGADAEKAQALFVSVDPERDTPEALKTYLSSFSARIRGLTGSEEAVAAMVKAYRAYAKKQPAKDGEYSVDHTAVVYLMDKNGNFVAPLNIKREPKIVADELRRYI